MVERRMHGTTSCVMRLMKISSLCLDSILANGCRRSDRHFGADPLRHLYYGMSGHTACTEYALALAATVSPSAAASRGRTCER